LSAIQNGWQPPKVDGFYTSVFSVSKIEMESIMKKAQLKSGFTIIEMLMSLVILATLMTAVAVAFAASITN
jgi:prepilin-type N-terminal cleavage/methylation domain-containing protein